MAQMAAFRTVWTAFVGVYEETLVLLAGNLAALALNLPILSFLVFVVLPLTAYATEAFGLEWRVIASLMTLMPAPGNVALAGLTRVAAGPDVPRFAELKGSLARHS